MARFSADKFTSFCAASDRSRCNEFVGEHCFGLGFTWTTQNITCTSAAKTGKQNLLRHFSPQKWCTVVISLESAEAFYRRFSSQIGKVCFSLSDRPKRFVFWVFWTFAASPDSKRRRPAVGCSGFKWQYLTVTVCKVVFSFHLFITSMNIVYFDDWFAGWNDFMTSKQNLGAQVETYCGFSLFRSHRYSDIYMHPSSFGF